MHVSSQGAPNVTPTPAHCANTSRSTPVKPCRHRKRSSYIIRWSRKLGMCALACSIFMAPLLQYRVQTIGVLLPSVRFIRRFLLSTLRKMNPVAEPYLWSSLADTAASASTTICTTTSSVSRDFLHWFVESTWSVVPMRFSLSLTNTAPSQTHIKNSTRCFMKYQ